MFKIFLTSAILLIATNAYGHGGSFGFSRGFGGCGSSYGGTVFGGHINSFGGYGSFGGCGSGIQSFGGYGGFNTFADPYCGSRVFIQSRPTFIRSSSFFRPRFSASFSFRR